ncbi:MAG TPA: hypothetical protein VK400_02095 [Pyrinomonadaceae bacterium]|nr:hypothetical protein [Pyrinomonadaceae bacterium]
MKQFIAGVIFILAFGSAAAFAQIDKDFCSEIKFAEEQRLLNVNEPARINVEVGEEFKKYKIEYLWTVSGGKLTRGQGTREIELTPGSADEGYNIFVTVKLAGLPENCLDTHSHTFAVTRRIVDRIYDRFGKLPKIDFYVRLDNLFVGLRNDPAAEGLIILAFDKTETRAKKIKRLNEILKHTNRRKFDKSRLKFFIVEEADEESTTLYIVPQDAKNTQVISQSEAQHIIRGEEIERKIKELFPPKQRQQQKKL